MPVGFKTGPRTFAEGQKIVKETGVKLCELWFRVDRAAEYQDSIAWLTRHKVRIGLHHWGLAEKKYKTNIMTHHSDIRQATLTQIKETIDIGQKIGCAYVNAHAGALRVEELNFSTNSQRLADLSPTTTVTALKLFHEAVQELNSYAQDRGVLLTFETLPGREASVFGFARDNVYDPGNASLEMIKAVSHHCFIANDITHTAAMIATKTTETKEIWSRLQQFTIEVAKRTRLLHINTVRPPHNGTDSHDGITAQDFATGVWPQQQQIITLLKIFRDRSDVFFIPEPRERMKENYLALKELMAQAQT